MTQNQHLLPSDFGLNSFQELIYQPPNRAGDHFDDFDAFRDALLIDLAPMRPHEAVMAENIIMIEWDIAQIITQKRHIARSAIYDEITNQYVKVERQVFADEQRRKRIDAIGANADIFEQLEYDNNYGKTFDRYHAEMNALQVITKLKSGKTDQIEQAQAQIKVDLPSPEMILAVVYETGSKYRDLDDVLSDLEKRRRRIMEDYNKLQSVTAIDVKAAE